MREDQHEILYDWNTVWVNSKDTGACLARFGRGGIDVHRDLQEQIEGKGQCLACTHTRPTEEDWQRFIALMKEHYGVEIKKEHKPFWVQKAKHGDKETGSSGG